MNNIQKRGGEGEDQEERTYKTLRQGSSQDDTYTYLLGSMPRRFRWHMSAHAPLLAPALTPEALAKFPIKLTAKDKCVIGPMFAFAVWILLSTCCAVVQLAEELWREAWRLGTDLQARKIVQKTFPRDLPCSMKRMGRGPNYRFKPDKKLCEVINMYIVKNVIVNCVSVGKKSK